MPTKPKPDSKVKFVQIAASRAPDGTDFYALDENGVVWNLWQGAWTKIESPNQD